MPNITCIPLRPVALESEPQGRWFGIGVAKGCDTGYSVTVMAKECACVSSSVTFVAFARLVAFCKFQSADPSKFHGSK
ncbi:hypothetical protein PILCRDRAFT_815281 [Piloderma croceum F 1598]|uniref:Uncharacterized protein n=1 Tax=Piloderma croceum (strain F 1598) TaxID=765440 RepID=A0A0C3FS43_PILCF|nr:hypothetical protein PILCRDRAFT_815281 [Piloderma croceum F 1598]